MNGPRRRKLLVASLGVASVSYVLACDKPPVSGNLPSPPPRETTPVSGNLPAPPPVDDADATPNALSTDSGSAAGGDAATAGAGSADGASAAKTAGDGGGGAPKKKDAPKK